MGPQESTTARIDGLAPGALDIDESAAYIGGIGRTTLYALIRDGEFPVLKIGRRSVIARSALDEFLARKAREATRGAAEQPAPAVHV